MNIISNAKLHINVTKNNFVITKELSTWGNHNCFVKRTIQTVGKARNLASSNKRIIMRWCIAPLYIHLKLLFTITKT
jgi:hypothetical protein